MNPLKSALVAVSLAITGQQASAVVLLTDNFTVLPGGTNNQDVNQALAGRLGGTMAAGFISGGNAYTGTTQNHHQVGNVATDVGQPVVSEGNYVLLAFDGGFQSNVDIAASAIGPITISFDAYHSSAANLDRVGGNDTLWTAFTLRTASSDNSGVWPIAPTSDQFGMLNRYNGGVQTFQNNGSSTPAGWDTPGFAIDPHWEITFTDTTGTGSAFNGNGSMMTFVNGTTTGSVALSQLASSGLYFGWRSYGAMFAGIDNLTISTVPEPSGAVVLAGGLGLLAFRRRRN